jgi:hypothetical protein
MGVLVLSLSSPAPGEAGFGIFRSRIGAKFPPYVFVQVFSFSEVQAWVRMSFGPLARRTEFLWLKGL